MRLSVGVLVCAGLLTGCAPAQGASGSGPQAFAGCYRLTFGEWHYRKEKLDIQDGVRSIQLTSQPSIPDRYGDGAKSLVGHLVAGPGFGPYAPPVTPGWNVIRDQPPGFVFRIADKLFGVEMVARGTGTPLTGTVSVFFDTPATDTSAKVTTVRAEATLQAERTACP